MDALFMDTLFMDAFAAMQLLLYISLLLNYILTDRYDNANKIFFEH